MATEKVIDEFGNEKELELVPLKSIYAVDTISQAKGWEKVYAALEGREEEFILDLSKTTIVEPWIHTAFSKLINKKNVYLKLKDCPETFNRVKTMFIMSGYSTDRIIYVESVKEKVETADELKVRTYGEGIIPFFKIDENNKATFKVKDKYTQIHSGTTVTYIKYAIGKIAETQGITEFLIDFGNMSIINTLLDGFADLIISNRHKGINVEINIEDTETFNQLGLYLHKALTKSYTDKERLRYLNKMFKENKNIPGMILKYKKSRAKDDFGRQGKGEVILCRVAIMHGLVKKNNKIKVKVTSFVDDSFCTKSEWASLNDNEILDRPETETHYISISDFGFGNEFLGEKFHFMAPIQRAASETRRIIVGFSDKGSNIYEEVTIPERMKIVFDNWGIAYNKEMLNDAIAETKEVLKNAEQ